MLISIQELLDTTQGKADTDLFSSDSFHPKQVSTDSRTLHSRNVFIPLKGEHFDGHAFLTQALELGCPFALCERHFFESHQEQLKTKPLVIVENTLKAYQAIGRLWRTKVAPIVIGITGSSGKTSTKEILYQLLSPYFKVHKTQANFNNEIGVPLTLLQLEEEHEICILEMGMRGLKQIQELAEIGRPQIGIISNIGPVHLSELGTIENVAQAKWELADYLKKHQGTLIINPSDPHLKNLANKTQGLNIISTGLGPQTHIHLLTQEDQLEGQHLRFSQAGKEYQATLNLKGCHQAINFLNCFAVLSQLKSDISPVLNIELPSIFGRSEIIPLGNNITLINDAYNANPDSMRASLDVFSHTQSQRRVAVLGYMGELGKKESHYHQELGKYCNSLKLDLLCVVGTQAKTILDYYQGKSVFFDSNTAAVNTLPQHLNSGDQVLFKASRSAKLEEIIDALKSAQG